MVASRTLFADRRDAGRRLAQRLTHLRGADVVVLGVPRGGVPVASEVSAGLGAPLDVVVVRKLGVPFQPELAMGAIGQGGVLVLNEEVLAFSGVDGNRLADIEERERAELDRRVQRFRGRSQVPLTGRTALVVDDGSATGATARAACAVARAQGSTRVVLAVPACSPRTARSLRGEVDELVVLETPEDFVAVGQVYDHFRPVTDETVLALLECPGQPDRSADEVARPATPDPPVHKQEVRIAAGRVRLDGDLAVPEHALGLVVFVHGSGSSRHSPRSRYVAGTLQEARLATLLFDLLTPGAEADRANVFAIDLLTDRLLEVVAWLREQPQCRGLRLALFGASTGAAAALRAAASLGAEVASVVSRGGRPDLAGPLLSRVEAPTLLVVGGLDQAVLEVNEMASARLRCEHRLVVVPGATHLFEEPGTLATLAELARDWFVHHVSRARQPTA